MSTQLLDFSYEDYIKNGKSIADSYIGDYIAYEKLDSGSFGSVYRGMHRQTGKEVAIKVVDLMAIERDDCSQRVKEIRRRLAKTESQMMMKVDHMHVIKCYAAYENKDLKIMVIEYCNGGTLSNEIYLRKRIPESEAISIIKQIISGISAMHKLGIVHRDLKTDNIMSHNGIYKVVDLGFAKLIPKESETYNTTLGTIITMAPEVMRKEKYGLKADIWSIGVILYEMVYGQIPYEPLKAPEMFNQIISKNIFPNGGEINGFRPSDDMIRLLKKILVVDQKRRVDWKELLEHDIFNPSGDLPKRLTFNVDIGELRKIAIPSLKPRDEEDVIENLPELKSIVKEQMRPAKIPNKNKEQQLAKIDRTDDRLLEWAKETHLECLKTELILKEIIIPIETQHLFNMECRQKVELMYLLSARCFCNMSLLNEHIEHKNHAIVENLRRTVKDLYESVSGKFSKYSTLLTKQEGKIKSIIGDRFSKIFSSEEMKQKDVFLTGLENLEFQKKEQINYTYDKYIFPVLGELDKKKPIYKYLSKYVAINHISQQELREVDFATRVREVLSGY